MLFPALALSLSLLGAADEAPVDPGKKPLEVELGKVVKVPVGYLKGLLCDSTTIIQPTLEDGTTANTFVVKGLQLGTTECRVGTERNNLFQIYRITVVKPKPPAAKTPSP
jgi:hypothetical protein